MKLSQTCIILNYFCSKFNKLSNFNDLIEKIMKIDQKIMKVGVLIAILLAKTKDWL